MAIEEQFGGFYIARKEGKEMEKNTYKLISRFECCGKAMVTVIMYGKAACVMHEIEFNRMIEVERKYYKRNRYKVA